jgi:hypothetical protein
MWETTGRTASGPRRRKNLSPESGGCTFKLLTPRSRELLRRLGAAARLQESGSDPRLATTEQVKAWRDVLAPERVDLTADEGEGGQDRTPARPSPRSVTASPGEGELLDLAARTARATIHSSTELPDLSLTNLDFRTFASGPEQFLNKSRVLAPCHFVSWRTSHHHWRVKVQFALLRGSRPPLLAR